MADVESQFGGSSDSTGEGPELEWVGTTMSPSKKALWQDLIGTKPVGPAGHYNPHGMLAAQRYVCVKYACAEALKNGNAVVVDVGAAPHRTYEFLQGRGRYMMPDVVAADRSRRGRCPPDAAEYVCKHHFEECTCHEGEDHVYLFVHSAYYIDPMWLWTKLSFEKCADALSVEHRFPDMFGGFYGEAHWMRSRETVSMEVVGNDRPYLHGLPPWQCGWVGERGEMIEAETLFSVDDCTRVVRLHPTMNGQPERPLVWTEVEADPNKAGPVQFSSAVRNAVGDNARFTQITFDLHRVRKFGPVLYTDFYFRGEQMTLTVPVNGIAFVANSVGNRTRTPELYQEVSYKMKNYWGRSRIPPSQLAAVTSAVIAIGFVINLHNEIDMTYTMREKFSWAMNVHSTLMQFGSVTVRRWPWILMAFMILLAGLIVIEVFDEETSVRVYLVMGFLGIILLCWYAMKGAMYVSRRWREYQEAGWVSSYAQDDGPRVPLLGNAFSIARNLPLPGSRYTKPDATDITGHLTLGATREKAFEPERLRVSGIVCDGALPNALATTQEAEKCAVTNRVLATRVNPEEEALLELGQTFSRSEFTRVRRGVDTGFTFFSKWVDKLRKSYPAVYCQAMIDVWRHNQGVEATIAATRGFLKVEKSAAVVHVDGAKATKARLIQPPEDVDKAITGPISWQLWVKIRDYWDGVKSPIMYCSGYTCSEIGKVVDNFLGEHSDVVGWSVDMATYDATLCLPLHLAAFKYYVDLGMPQWLVSWFLRVRSRGTTPNAVTYMPTRVYAFDDEGEADELAALYRKHKLIVRRRKDDITNQFMVEVEDFQMTSGRMDTNLTDTVILVASVLAKMPNIPYLLLACGDDGFLLLRKEDEKVVDVIKEFQLRLGLKPEGVVTSQRSKWEFCSKLFWYGVDPKTGATKTVLGSKPFRGITRMGVNTTLPGAANAAASALSVRIDSGHVPFLGPFADRTYELCKTSRMKPTGKAEWSSIKSDYRYHPSPLNYVITQERYGLGKENEDEFVARLSNLDRVPIVLQYEPLLDAVRVDEA